MTYADAEGVKERDLELVSGGEAEVETETEAVLEGGGVATAETDTELEGESVSLTEGELEGDPVPVRDWVVAAERVRDCVAAAVLVRDCVSAAVPLRVELRVAMELRVLVNEAVSVAELEEDGDALMLEEALEELVSVHEALCVGVRVRLRVGDGVHDIGVGDTVGDTEGTGGAARTVSVATEMLGSQAAAGAGPTAAPVKMRQGCAPAGRMPTVERSAQLGAVPPARAARVGSGEKGAPAYAAPTPSADAAIEMLTLPSGRKANRGEAEEGAIAEIDHSLRSLSNHSHCC